MVLGRLEADIFPNLGNDDIDAIEPSRLLEVIRKIEARDALEMAKRVRHLLRRGYSNTVSPKAKAVATPQRKFIVP